MHDRLEQIWNTSLLPHIISINTSPETSFVAFEATPKIGISESEKVAIAGPDFFTVRSARPGVGLHHCVIKVHATDDLKHQTDWIGYLPTLNHADSYILHTTGSEVDIMRQTATTVNGTLSITCDEGMQSDLVASGGNPIGRGPQAPTIERSNEFQERIKEKDLIGKTLIAKARKLFAPPADPISTKEKLLAAFKPGRKYVAHAASGPITLTIQCDPFDGTSMLVEGDCVHYGRDGSPSSPAKLIGHFQEETGRGTVLSFLLPGGPDGARKISQRVLWLVTDPEAIFHLDSHHFGVGGRPHYIEVADIVVAIGGDGLLQVQKYYGNANFLNPVDTYVWPLSLE